ncbi:MAG: hypothetical protein ABI885_12760 [Gammaproteobacteria bacterium]
MRSCDAHVVVFYDFASERTWSLPIEFLAFSWDDRHNRLLVAYTRSGGTLMMGVVRE